MASVANNHHQHHQQAIATATGSRPHSLPPSYTHSIQVLHNVAAGAAGLPHGLGLLTTVASLPPKYRSRYLNIKTKCEIPLDLSVKPPSPVPMATAFAELQSEPVAATPACTASPTASPSPSPVTSVVENVPAVQEVAQEVVVITEKPITPPQSPVSKRKLSEQSEQSLPPAKLAKSDVSAAAAVAATIDATPQKPIKVSDTAPRTGKSTTASARASTSAAAATTTTRNKATRKLKFDEETSSPVSGTIIRPLEDITDGSVQYSNGDIDPKYNIVEITEETKAELAAIKNVIGDYVCRLCRIKFDDAFGLARHRCACIVLLEYRCPECGKQFNCPANLASHRRWHKPKKGENAASGGGAGKKENRNTSNQQAPEKQPALNPKKSGEELAFGCDECGKRFKRAAYLRKHQQTHVKKTQAVLDEQETEQQSQVEPTTATTITGSFQTTVYKSNSSASSSASSSHSHEDEGVYVVGAASSSHCDYEADYLSDCSSSTSSAGYGRLQIVEHGLTEEESIAAAALTNLRNCASVIQHTTMAH